MTGSARQVRLRILTGTHAGAEVCLGQGNYTIGSEATCDICISDWCFKKSRFEVTCEGNRSGAVKFDEATRAAILSMNEPTSIGDIAVVFCTTDGTATMQSDLEILKQMLLPVKETVPEVPAARKSKGLWIVVGICMLAAVIVSAAFHATGSVAATKAASVAQSPLAQVRKVVGRAQYPGIRVGLEGNRVVVAGLLQSSTERQQLAAQLKQIRGVPILHRYAVEGEITAAITDAIAQPGIVVKHVGNGRFEVGGEVTPRIRQRVDLGRLKADLGPIVKSLSFAEAPVPAMPVAEFNESQKNSGYQFRIAADGSKYFVPQ